MAHDLHVHEPPLEASTAPTSSTDVTVDTRPDVTPVKPYWLDVENCNVDPVYDVAGRQAAAAPATCSRWSGPCRRPAGSWRAAGTCTAAARRSRCAGPTAARAARSTPRGRPGAARATRSTTCSPVLHEPGPIHMSGFNSARGIPLAAGEKVVLEANYDAALPHTRVMGIMVVVPRPDASVTAELRRSPGRHGRAAGASRAAAQPPPFRVPIVGRRGGKAVNINAPPGRRVRARQARNHRGRRPLLPPAQRVAARGWNAHVALRRRRRSTTSRLRTGRAVSPRRTSPAAASTARS